ncbi:hypothetical protein [Novosphingobium colocasiae]|uniref:Outer membrane protein beta-barrel domain-containing protein n=1 Tax=Novosphingobium colocasiae TaxID=1256513 RepID=A0A918UG78_9SPHN|nr:hypothetical protein [Novosphingobium colocasiae]GGZ03311.1 hypothetical protein GCM10011614_17760 [Novosphingobium colocasiae]
MLGKVLACLALGMACWPAMAHAEAETDAWTGDIGLYSRYLDYDLFPLTPGPVFQGALYYQFSKGCQGMAWGSHGIEKSTGGELDLGVYCSLEVAEVTVTAGALRSFLRRVPDSTTVSFGLSHANFDVTAERYVMPGPDGTRIYGGYTAQPMNGLTLYPMLVYETGMGLPDLFGGGLRTELDVVEDVSLFALALLPITKGDGDTRSSELAVGIRYSF